MTENRGKKFEHVIREAFEKVPEEKLELRKCGNE